MDYFKIDGIAFDVLVTEVRENFNILYSENTGRTLSKGARMVLDPLGTFYGHNITIQRKPGHEQEFDDLFEHVSRSRPDGMMVEFVHNQKTITYEAYVSNGERSLKKINRNTGVVLWDSITLNFVPMEAQSAI
jgi:hypothetical protein